MGKRKMYNTTLNVDLTRELKILAAQLDKRQNNLLEEAIQDLLKKYKNKEEQEPTLDPTI
jgi:predicted transcriptional regulator